MEDSWIESNNEEHIFLHEQFHKCCPFFLSIGMTYDQFWKEDLTIAKDYLEAYKLKTKREVELKEWNIWKQGVYIYEALCDVSPILHAFAKKGVKPLPYPTMPYGMENSGKEIEENREPTKQEKENEKIKAQIFFNNWARATQKQFKNNEEG